MEALKHRRQFINTFDSLCQRHPKFTVWSDFIHMAAYAISNACDYRQDREDEYLRIVKRYSKEELDKISELLGLTIMALDFNRHQDFLGQLYMDYGFGDSKKGEYFTPYDVAALMARLAGNEKSGRERYVTLNDPACGSGVMFIAYTNLLLESGGNPHLDVLIAANDIDPCIALMCYIQLSLLGCAGYVSIRNTLTNPVVGTAGDEMYPSVGTAGGELYPPEDAFLTPMFFHPVWRMRCLLNKMERIESRECS